MSEKKNNKNPYQDTLNLPKTDFSQRAHAATKEPEFVRRWKDECLAAKSWDHNKGEKKFVLHDGPPYANGHLHLGHVLNKTLKDIVTKYKRMQGFHVPVKPGWDCHGLPIELKVLGEHKEKLDKKSFKKACREYASKWIETQKEEFEDLGVLMDWDHPYVTMNPEYEASILRAFAKFVDSGYIERKGKTVPWCASCQTVLAAAEIEYEDRKDPSIYVLFPFDKKDSQKLFSDVDPETQVSFLVWTTTPWTLPLNRAVVLNPGAKYVVLQLNNEKQAIIVAKDLADKICEILKIEKKVLAEFDSQVMQGQKVNHVFIENLKVPVLLDNSVLLDEGTACLHSAPGCGPEDYFLGVKNNLEIFSPISADGRYTEGIEPKELKGMKVTDGQIWVLKKLTELGRLVHKASIKHSYPHCWRCHNGLIFRATDQWFCDLQKNNLVEKSLKEIENVEFIPDWGKARLRSFVSNRTEWCISRQRMWGVPIPALICNKCEYAHISAELINKVADNVAKEGIEFWDEVQVVQLVDKSFKCTNCGNNDLSQFKKETDILDVWFDSGVSHFAVLAKEPENLGVPADLYLEGSDQHRGWFQSSLLSSMILNGKSCTKAILTHGFFVDEKGKKMSKSLGNVIYPQDVIKRYSRDILRLWVASSDYQGDVAISERILKNVSECYRKIRNTCRFLLSNLYDFDIKKDGVSFEELLHIDQYALHNLFELNNKVLNYYKDYNFAGVFHTLNSYCVNDLSALYLDISKDRLYVEKADGLLRRSAQTVIYHILDTIIRLIAPMAPFLSEEVSDFYQTDKKQSIHLQNFVDVQETTPASVTYSIHMQGVWNLLEILREAVLKAIEQKREAGLIKHSLEAKVKLYLNAQRDEQQIIEAFIKELKEKEDSNRFFKDWFIVSQIELVDSQDSLEATELPWAFVLVEHAKGNKCPRCWQWDAQAEEGQLCSRCKEVLKR